MDGPAYTPNMAVSFDEVVQMPLNAEPANVEMVMINGRSLKEYGKVLYTPESLDQLIETNQQTVKRFMHRPDAERCWNKRV